MKRKTYKAFSKVVIGFLVAAWIVFIVLVPEERLEATGVFALLIGGAAWNLYEAYRAAERERGFRNEDGSWPK